MISNKCPGCGAEPARMGRTPPPTAMMTPERLAEIRERALHGGVPRSNDVCLDLCDALEAAWKERDAMLAERKKSTPTS